MLKINLLPSEMKVAGSTNKVARLLRQLSVIQTVLTVLSALSVLGIFIYLKTDLDKINKASSVIKQEINTLSQSEQRLIFAKDRLSKISEVRAQKNALGELVKYNNLYNYIVNAGSLSVSEVGMDSDKLELSASTGSYTAITNFINFLQTQQKEFQSVSVTAFTYTPNAGYVINMVIEGNEKS